MTSDVEEEMHALTVSYRGDQAQMKGSHDQ